MRQVNFTRSMIILSVVLFAVCGIARAAETTAPTANKSPIPKSPIKVTFNQDFVEGLRTPFDFEVPKNVLDLVFPQLADTVRVYPTENYYYYSFHAAGRTVWGNLRLDAVDRDRGILYVGYFTYDENGRTQDRVGHVQGFDAKDGVVVSRKAPFEYEVQYRGRTVRFLLNEVGMNPPQKAKLRASEVFVGPVFDESGLRFYLVFDRDRNHLFYLLNEDETFVPETFDDVSEWVEGAPVVIGRRTGFAFFVDEPNQRKVLVAINARNTARNNYYDGPFDQLPDNYADQTNMRRYIEAAYPYMRGGIDRYGTYLTNRGARMAILSYYRYESVEHLAFVPSCRATAKDEGAFYECITPDFQKLSLCPDGPNGTCYRSTPDIAGEATLTIEVANDNEPVSDEVKPSGR